MQDAGPQRSVAAVVAAGFAVILAALVVAWVAKQPGAEHSTKATAAMASPQVGTPTRVDDSVPTEVLVAQDDVPAGMDLGAALDHRHLAVTQVPVDLRPEDALANDANLPGRPLDRGLRAGVIVTGGAVAPSKPSAPAPSGAPCPKDWQGTVPPGDALVFVVTAPVTVGTTVAQAFADGSIGPRFLSQRYTPTAAAHALAPVCLDRFTFDLSKGTLVTSGTFAAGG